MRAKDWKEAGRRWAEGGKEAVRSHAKSGQEAGRWLVAGGRGRVVTGWREIGQERGGRGDTLMAAGRRRQVG